jgi:hypothetical protein
VRADAVEEQAHDDPPARGVRQELEEPAAGLVGVPDVDLQVDVVPCAGDPRLERGVELLRVAQDVQAAG